MLKAELQERVDKLKSAMAEVLEIIDRAGEPTRVAAEVLGVIDRNVEEQRDLSEPTRVGPFTMLPGQLQEIQEAHAALALRVLKLEEKVQLLVADTRKEIKRLDELLSAADI